MRTRRAAAQPKRMRHRPTLRLPFAAHIALWLLLGFSVAALSAWAVWLLLGQPTLRPASSGQASTQDKFDGLKIALTVVGGIGGAIALTVAYRKQRLSEAAERREDTKVFAERFSKASELIGSSEAAMRLAGIYAMSALADDWDDHRQTCIDVLCAYLRMPYTPPLTSPSPPKSGNRGLGLRKPPVATHHAPTPAAAPSEDPREEQQVRHTVIRVIATHLRPGASVSWNGYTFDFTGATLDGGDLSQVEIEPTTTMIFRNATFRTGRFSFGFATFFGGDVDFRAAMIAGGTVDFGGAVFTGGLVDFGDAEFSSGRINFICTTFSDGTLSFSNTIFSGCTVSFLGARFVGGAVNFRTRLSDDIGRFGAKFSGSIVEFKGAQFSTGTVDFRDAEFSGGLVDLSTADDLSMPPLFDRMSEEASRWVRLPTPT